MWLKVSIKSLSRFFLWWFCNFKEHSSVFFQFFQKILSALVRNGGVMTTPSWRRFGLALSIKKTRETWKKLSLVFQQHFFIFFNFNSWWKRFLVQLTVDKSVFPQEYFIWITVWQSKSIFSINITKNFVLGEVFLQLHCEFLFCVVVVLVVLAAGGAAAAVRSASCPLFLLQ